VLLKQNLAGRLHSQLEQFGPLHCGVTLAIYGTFSTTNSCYTPSAVSNLLTETHRKQRVQQAKRLVHNQPRVVAKVWRPLSSRNNSSLS